MKESITDRYIGIGTGVGVVLGFILKMVLDSSAGLVIGIGLGIGLGVFGGSMAGLIKQMSRKSNMDKKKLAFYFWCGCAIGVVAGIVGMAFYLIENG